MSAVRRASTDASKKTWTDTDSDDDALSAARDPVGLHLMAVIPESQLLGPPAAADPSAATVALSQSSLTTVVVFGADGNLARRKTFPALFNLMYKQLLDDDAVIIGYARAPMDTEDFRAMVKKSIYSPTVANQPRNTFLAQVTYESGQFDSEDDYRRLRAAIEAREEAQVRLWHLSAHGGTVAVRPPRRVRLYYLAVPSFLYFDICRGLKLSAIAADQAVDRFVLEKPFGRDTETCDALLAQLSAVLTEDVSYRIDHYLGKELIMSLLVLRFANICFEAIWNRQNVASVQVIFKERVGLDGRGGYFDQYGVIRDVMQNHLTQILALVAMEQPLSMDAKHILQEKIKVLKCVRPIARRDLVVGQYAGYLDEDSITNKQSTTETFAAAVVKIHNPRWAGVPFVLKAGKALNESRAEVRIRFQSPPGVVSEFKGCPENELIIRVQPNEGIYWKIQNKVPGLDFEVAPMRMDLTYQQTHRNKRPEMPEAYERLILNVLRGDKSHFVHADELRLSWQIFSPVLHELERSGERPHAYTRGTRGPVAADELAQRYGMRKFGSQRYDSSAATAAALNAVSLANQRNSSSGSAIGGRARAAGPALNGESDARGSGRRGSEPSLDATSPDGPSRRLRNPFDSSDPYGRLSPGPQPHPDGPIVPVVIDHQSSNIDP